MQRLYEEGRRKSIKEYSEAEGNHNSSQKGHLQRWNGEFTVLVKPVQRRKVHEKHQPDLDLPEQLVR